MTVAVSHFSAQLMLFLSYGIIRHFLVYKLVVFLTLALVQAHSALGLLFQASFIYSSCSSSFTNASDSIALLQQTNERAKSEKSF